jgi:hypothetical protein
LNIDFGIENKRQDCKLGTVCVHVGDTCGIGKMNGGDEDEGIWLMGFIYIHELE